ncbi:hypothetical protein D3C87_1996700 [compost metagenome]
MAQMILPAEEHRENTHGLFALIDIEIKHCLIFRYPADAWRDLRRHSPLKRRFMKGLHIGFN